MGLQFKRNESVRKGFGRLGRRQMLRALKQTHQRDSMDALHEVRKSIKRARAFLRLFRPCLEKIDYSSCSKLLREAARRLCTTRDAYVKLHAFDSLRDQLRKELSPSELSSVRRVLARECELHQQRFAANNTVPHVRRLFKSTCYLLDKMRVKQSGWAALAPGIKKSYRAGKRAFAELKTQPTGEHFHLARKRVKDLYYQLGFLKSLHPASLARSEEKLERLGECLGDDHDLLLLAESAGAHSPGTIKILRRVIARKQKDLRSKAMRLGSDFYNQKPSVFCKTLEGYWKAWRQAPDR